MEIKKIIQGLHPLERAVIPALAKSLSLIEIAKKTGLQEVEVMRAFQWLQNKEIIKIKEDVKELAELDDNGKRYSKSALPERNFLKALEAGELALPDLVRAASLSSEEVNICVGILRNKAAINIRKEKELVFSITGQGKELLLKGLPEEHLIKKEFPIETSSLTDIERFALENLKKRKNIIKVRLAKNKFAELTELGKKIVKEDMKKYQMEERLTSSMLKDGSWDGKSFRRFDIKINVPSIYGGRKQHYRKFLESVRHKFLSLGFSEMSGKIVESEFWNMDALFMPQFHSARDIHSAYYIKSPKHGELDNHIVERVRQSHENGFGTSSLGWQYKFSTDKTKNNLLRTQGTACSARMLASKDLKIPGKYFAIARCFRPDVIDATHNVDFYQTEGIVVEEGLKFSHLKGMLKMFAEEFAKTDKIKITPAYFPFTEPSAELHAKHPELGWIELAGSGIFRPEVVKPLLGKDVSVLAWGIGIDRIAMFNLGIKDIRQLFSHDLNLLRKIKTI